jgi:hypothetical protein
MKRMVYLAIGIALATSSGAQTVGGLAEIAIIDRDSGIALSPHFYNGEYWVAGKPGARYAIQIHNRLGERVLAVTSVDGIDVVSGATAGWDQGGYVFGPGERYQITGWRKTDAEVAAFTFADSSNSYAERTGRPANVGVIGVAIFRERLPLPVDAPPLIGQASPRADASRADESGANKSFAKPSAPVLRAPAPAARLGTGHGEREYSHVDHTEFLRMQARPNEIIRIHYDSLDNLFAMGIIKRPRPVPPAANPFPATPEQQYVPDPPG